MSSLLPFEGGEAGCRETWMVLEFCPRGSLQDAVDRGCFRPSGSGFAGSVDLSAILRTASEVAGAMAYLHSLGIVHAGR